MIAGSFTYGTATTGCFASFLGFSYTTASTVAGFSTTASCFALYRDFLQALAALEYPDFIRIFGFKFKIWRINGETGKSGE